MFTDYLTIYITQSAQTIRVVSETNSAVLVSDSRRIRIEYEMEHIIGFVSDTNRIHIEYYIYLKKFNLFSLIILVCKHRI